MDSGRYQTYWLLLFSTMISTALCSVRALGQKHRSQQPASVAAIELQKTNGERQSFETLATKEYLVVVFLGTECPLPPHRMFSMMACATIGGALISDLLFLPALLKWLIRKPSDILRELQSEP